MMDEGLHTDRHPNTQIATLNRRAAATPLSNSAQPPSFHHTSSPHHTNPPPHLDVTNHCLVILQVALHRHPVARLPI
jgi:hypothetical protein